MHKVRFKTDASAGYRAQYSYATSFGGVAYNPLEAEVTKTVERPLFKGEAHPGYVLVTSPLPLCEKLFPEQAREIAKSLEILADKAESLPNDLENLMKPQKESESAHVSEADGSARSPEEFAYTNGSPNGIYTVTDRETKTDTTAAD